MKIAIIVRKLSVQGGTQRQALNLAIQLQARGDDVTIYALRYEKGKGFTDLIDRIHVVALPEHRAPQGMIARIEHFFPLFFIDQLRENRDARDLARLIDPKTEFLHPHHDPVTYKTAYYFKKYAHHIPSVWMMNDLTTKYGSFLRARELYGQKRLGLAARIGYMLFDAWERVRFIRAQNVITVLNHHDQDLARRYLKREAIVVHSGIDISQFPFVPRELPVGDNRLMRLLMVGIFFTHRRFEDAIEAVSILTQSGVACMLTIIGDPTTDRAYAAAMANVARNYNLTKTVIFRGRVEEKELMNAYTSHDIFLFPSHLQSWGLAVFEAMASGLPVIVSKTAGASEILTHGKNALIVDPKSPEQIVNAICRLFDHPDFYARLSRNARVFVQDQVSWERYAGTMRGIFENVKRAGIDVTDGNPYTLLKENNRNVTTRIK